VNDIKVLFTLPTTVLPPRAEKKLSAICGDGIWKVWLNAVCVVGTKCHWGLQSTERSSNDWHL